MGPTLVPTSPTLPYHPHPSRLPSPFPPSCVQNKRAHTKVTRHISLLFFSSWTACPRSLIFVSSAALPSLPLPPAVAPEVHHVCLQRAPAAPGGGLQLQDASRDACHAVQLLTDIRLPQLTASAQGPGEVIACCTLWALFLPPPTTSSVFRCLETSSHTRSVSAYLSLSQSETTTICFHPTLCTVPVLQ